MILSGGVYKVASTLSGFILSLLIIRTQSVTLWGEVVYFILLIDLAFVVIAWGNTPYLVREFSIFPNLIQTNFIKSVTSRTPLVLLFIAALWALPNSAEVCTVLSLWCAGRFLYQSFDPVIQFERKFAIAFVIEAGSLLVVAVPLLLSETSMASIDILKLYSLSFLFRATLVIIFFRKLFQYVRHTSLFQLEYFQSALPFLLLTLTAMLQQRSDLYLVAKFLTADDTAHYQVFLNLLLLGHLSGSLILSPFAKNIFRLPGTAAQKLERKFAKAGFALALLYITCCFVVINYFYQFNFPWVMYVIGYFYVLMFYLYLLKSYQLQKEQRYWRMAGYSFAGSILNATLCFLAIPRIGITGALFAGLMTQVFMVIAHHWDTLRHFFWNADAKLAK